MPHLLRLFLASGLYHLLKYHCTKPVVIGHQQNAHITQQKSSCIIQLIWVEELVRLLYYYRISKPLSQHPRISCMTEHQRTRTASPHQSSEFQILSCIPMSIGWTAWGGRTMGGPPYFILGQIHCGLLLSDSCTLLSAIPPNQGLLITSRQILGWHTFCIPT